MSFTGYINIGMAVIYIFCGMYLLFGRNIFEFTEFQRIGLSFILLTYGSFRVYDNIRKNKKSEDDKI